MSMKLVNEEAMLVLVKAIFNTKEGIRRGLIEVAPLIEREVVRLIKSPPKTGRVYVIGGKFHQASAPGEAPANLTGRLADSVGSLVKGSDKLTIGDRKDIAPYGKLLEGNFPNKIAPRPHLKPAALSKSREVGQAIVLGVKRRLRNIR